MRCCFWIGALRLLHLQSSHFSFYLLLVGRRLLLCQPIGSNKLEKPPVGSPSLCSPLPPVYGIDQQPEPASSSIQAVLRWPGRFYTPPHPPPLLPLQLLQLLAPLHRSALTTEHRTTHCFWPSASCHLLVHSFSCSNSAHFSHVGPSSAIHRSSSRRGL